MATINLAPKNLSEIRKHFRQHKLEIQNKLTCLYKKKKAIQKDIDKFEADLKTMNDGEEWCESIYKAGKGK